MAVATLGGLVRRAKEEREKALRTRVSVFLGEAFTAVCEYEPRLKECGIDRVSAREADVLSLIGQGKTTNEIAAALELSKKTVETHRESLKKKLVAENTVQLTRFAVLLDLAARMPVKE